MTPNDTQDSGIRIDAVMPQFEGIRIEDRIVEGSIEGVYREIRQADFIKTSQDKPVVRLPFAVRTAAERLVTRLRGRKFTPYGEVGSMRLADTSSRGEWCCFSVELHEEANNDAGPDRIISTAGVPVATLVVYSREDFEIAAEVRQFLAVETGGASARVGSA